MKLPADEAATAGRTEALGPLQSCGLALLAGKPAGCWVWEPWPLACCPVVGLRPFGVRWLCRSNGMEPRKLLHIGTGRWLLIAWRPGNQIGWIRPAAAALVTLIHGPSTTLFASCRPLRMWPRQLRHAWAYGAANQPCCSASSGPFHGRCPSRAGVLVMALGDGTCRPAGKRRSPSGAGEGSGGSAQSLLGTT